MVKRNRKHLVTSSTGDAYYVSPSAIGASELNVTTPPVTVIGRKPRPFDKLKRWFNTEFSRGEIRHMLDDLRTFGLYPSETDDGVTRGIVLPGVLDGAGRVPINSSHDVAKFAKSVLEHNNDNTGTAFVKAYDKLINFLSSPAYKKRLRDYYKNKGSSVITINTAPEELSNRQLYNISTTKTTVIPEIIDQEGKFMDAWGAYFPDDRLIQVKPDALTRDTPMHEMIHARNDGQVFLDNAAHKMRTKAEVELNRKLKEGEIMKDSPIYNLLQKDAAYYGNVIEQEPRVLNTLRDMQERGIDINNLTDNVINKYFDAPIESFGSDTQSLLENYEFEDIPNALRNFKGLLLPLGIGLTGYGLNKKRLGGRVRFEMGGGWTNPYVTVIRRPGTKEHPYNKKRHLISH